MKRINAVALLLVALFAASCGGQSEEAKRKAAIAKLDAEVKADAPKREALQNDLDALDADTQATNLETKFQTAEPHLQGLCAGGQDDPVLAADDVKNLEAAFRGDPETYRPKLVTLANDLQDCLPSVATKLDRLLDNG